MAIRIFTIPICNSEEAQEEANRFLRSHRVLSVERRWVERQMDSVLVLIVDYLDGNAGVSRSGGGPPRVQSHTNRQRIDYREVLKPEEFAVYARLRDWRKKTSENEGVPLYQIFTNEQLAQMVQQKMKSRADLSKLPGVGEARLERFATGALGILSNAWGTSDETNRPAA